MKLSALATIFSLISVASCAQNVGNAGNNLAVPSTPAQNHNTENPQMLNAPRKKRNQRIQEVDFGNVPQNLGEKFNDTARTNGKN